MTVRSVDMSVEISGLSFKNPVLTASGTFGYGLEFARFFDLSELGGFCTKGLSLDPMPGNPPGRIAETPAGMLNAIGLENVGTSAFINEKLPALETCGCHIIANIFGKTIDEFIAIAERLNRCPQVSALELNISCPNIKEGGVQFGHDVEMTFQVTDSVRRLSSKPVWVKLSPNVTDIRRFASACESAGASAVTLVNTFIGMSIDVKKRRPMLSNSTGGLSGPAIRPLAVRMVREVFEEVSIPVIGIGGIASWRDAMEFILAGAAAVQVGTANFFDPLAAVKVIRGLEEYCREQNVSRVRDLVGSVATLEPGQFVYY